MKNKAERVKKRRRRVRDNVQIVVLLVLALFFLTLCRYGWVQIVKGAEMSERVRSRRAARSSMRTAGSLPSPR